MYQPILNELYQHIRQEENKGQVAAYIPELGKINPEKFGIYLQSVHGEHFEVGDSRERFSIQSIAKVLSLSLAYRMLGAKLWKRVGVEPSGTPFNSLVQLEYDEGIPRNPLINAGAIVISDILVSELKKPQEDFLHFVREAAHNDQITYSEAVAESERENGFRNLALINFLKSFGNIKNEVEEVLDFYFRLCAIQMSCQELTRAFLFLANGGHHPHSEKQILTRIQAKRINAIMQTCGFYDEAGEFAYRVGLPGKSGVGGGIVAVHPGYYAISVWSPRLNQKGNSFRGMRFLEQFTSRTESSIF